MRGKAGSLKALILTNEKAETKQNNTCEDIKKVQNINKSEVDHIENAEKNQYLIRGSESNQKLSKIIHDFSRNGQKGKQFTKKQFRQEKSNLEEKDLVKELNKNSSRSPTREQKKIHLVETSI